MRLLTAGLALLITMTAAHFAAAQTPPAPAATRIVVAATKLPTVTDVPLHFRLVRVTLSPGERSSPSGNNRGPLPSRGINRRFSLWRCQSA